MCGLMITVGGMLLVGLGWPGAAHAQSHDAPPASGVVALPPPVVARSPDRATAETLVITLRPNSVVEEHVVTIGAVGDLQGGEVWLRQWIRNLDVAEVSQVGRSVVVSREQLSMRIQLAGVGIDKFRIDGPVQAMVKLKAVEMKEKEFAMPAQQNLAQQTDQVVIHPRDNIKLVALVGNLRVTVTGEAQQDGKLGQMIRVRNTDSGKVVVGRVLDRSTVEVEY
jgi:flagella basal body P-ring formation protein FlgA